MAGHRDEIPQDGAAAKEDAGPAEAAPKLSAAERRAAQKELQRIERRIEQKEENIDKKSQGLEQREQVGECPGHRFTGPWTWR